MSTTPIYYCPCCGTPMDVIVCTFDFPRGTKHITQVTCYERTTCAFATYTISPDHANQTKRLFENYHVTRRFDVFTGQEIASDTNEK